MRNSSSFVRIAGSTEAVALAAPLVPTAPVVELPELVEPVVVDEPAADPDRRAVRVVFTSLYAARQSSCVVIN